jgi:hypothetical protein
VLKNLAGHSDMQIEASTDPAHTQKEKLAFFSIASPQIGYSVMTKGLDPKNVWGPFPAVNAQERLKEIGKRNCAIGIPWESTHKDANSAFRGCFRPV